MKKHTRILFPVMVMIAFIIQSCSKNKSDNPVPATATTDSLAQAELFSGVWVDSIDSTRKVTFANVIGSNQFIGTDELYGDPHVINLSGICNNRLLDYTVIIKYQPTGYNKWYITYKGIITDTSFGSQRIKVYSVLDTLYLKPQ